MSTKKDISDLIAEVGQERAMEALLNTPPDRIAREWNSTDLGNAERFAFDHGERLRHVAASGYWHRWDGRRWKRDDTGEVYRLAAQTVRKIYGEAAEAGDGDRRKALGEHARRSENISRIKAMVELGATQPEIAIRSEDFDRCRWSLNLSNGTVDLRTGKIRKHDRNDLITRLSPVAYDPAAKCDLWLGFLDRCFGGDSAMVDFIRRWCGYCLSGDTGEQRFVFLHGTGANGKSVLSEVVSHILGEYSRTAPGTLIALSRDGQGAIPNDVAMLDGARAAFVNETEDGSRMAESKIKSLTGGDRITARFLHREFFEFTPQFKLWVVGNHRPHVGGQDEGIWRRILLVPFLNVIPPDERDPELKSKLIAEAPGILAWMVGGCLDWQKSGLKIPAKVTAASGEYRHDMDRIGAFLEERCDRVVGAWISTADLYAAYVEHAKASGEHPYNKINFTRRLGDKGVESQPTKHARGWAGIILKPTSGDGW